MSSGEIKYPYLDKWIYSHGYTNMSFANAIGIEKSHFVRLMNGNGNPMKKTIDKIMKVTGLPYEVAFAETTSAYLSWLYWKVVEGTGKMVDREELESAARICAEMIANGSGEVNDGSLIDNILNINKPKCSCYEEGETDD